MPDEATVAFAAGKFRVGSERSFRLGPESWRAASDNAPAIGGDGSELRVSYESGLAGSSLCEVPKAGRACRSCLGLHGIRRRSSLRHGDSAAQGEADRGCAARSRAAPEHTGVVSKTNMDLAVLRGLIDAG